MFSMIFCRRNTKFLSSNKIIVIFKFKWIHLLTCHISWGHKWLYLSATSPISVFYLLGITLFLLWNKLIPRWLQFSNYFLHNLKYIKNSKVIEWETLATVYIFGKQSVKIALLGNLRNTRSHWMIQLFNIDL